MVVWVKMRTLWLIVTYLFSGLRFRLLLLVLITCAPLIALTLHTSWEDRRRAVFNWRQKSDNIVQHAQQEEDRLINEGRQLLMPFSVSEPVKANDQAACRKLLSQFCTGRYQSLAVLNSNAQVIASASNPASGTEPFHLNSAQADLCRRVIGSGAFMVGDFPCPLPQFNTVLNFAYPVCNPAGQPQGAVLASVDVASWLNPMKEDHSDLASQLRGATWTQIDRKGNIVLRSPSLRNWIGQPYPNEAVMKSAWSQREGITEEKNSAGVETFYGFGPTQSQLTPAETVGILSLPKDTLFAAADRTLFRNLGWLGMAAAMAFLLGWFGSDLLIVRPVKALVRSSTRLA